MRLHTLLPAPTGGTKPAARKRSLAAWKPMGYRRSLRKHAGSTSSDVHYHCHTQDPGMHDRKKRVWKACDRCQMKKLKCDSHFPCKRCQDNGLVCTSGVRKKVERKQLPLGYIELIENTHLTLIATIHKLYSMVRDSQPWDLDEPDINDFGLPVIHDIAQKLDCIRPNKDKGLSSCASFPEDEASMTKVAQEFKEQNTDCHSQANFQGTNFLNNQPNYDASSSDFDCTDLENSHTAISGVHAMGQSSQSFVYRNNFNAASPVSNVYPNPIFTPENQSLSHCLTWSMLMSQTTELAMNSTQHAGTPPNINWTNQNIAPCHVAFNTVNPSMLSIPERGTMFGMEGPNINGIFNNESGENSAKY